jgi:DNA-directed RNA polymerase specialized sigma subunit
MSVREAINTITYSNGDASAREDAINELWHNYKDTGDRDAREHLIIYYSPLVRHVAARMAAELPSSVDISDLVSYGVLGLMDAIKRFDLERDIRFDGSGARRHPRRAAGDGLGAAFGAGEGA